MVFDKLINRIWYQGHPAVVLLVPISWMYGLIVKFRYLLYHSGLLSTNTAPVPVIVVGNITVGGTGKTPFVVWLANYLFDCGYRPGILSRGYGVKSRIKVQQVRADSDPDFVGDEPVLIAKRTGLPVAISADRYEAARQLIEYADCNILICDDGLQHFALNRDLEIAVIDGDRAFGNAKLLPAGPLRESIHRLSSVDLLISKGKQYKKSHVMEYQYGEMTSVVDETRKSSISSLLNQEIHVVTGIANPERFHEYIKAQGIHIIKHVYPDHYQYRSQDLSFRDDKPIVMTEKDAVKCCKFARDNMWYIPIQAKFNNTFHHRIKTLIRDKIDGQKIT